LIFQIFFSEKPEMIQINFLNKYSNTVSHVHRMIKMPTFSKEVKADDLRKYRPVKVDEWERLRKQYDDQRLEFRELS